MAEDTDGPSPPVSPAGGRERHRFGALAGTLVAVVLVALFAVVFVLLRQPGSPGSLGILTSGAPVPASWVTYRDPAGYFTIRIPPQWHATVSTSSGTYGDRTGSYSYTAEDVSLSSGTSILQEVGVDIYAEPISNAFARHFTCTARTGPFNATIAGQPATDLGWTWLLNTENAHYQISTPFSPHTSPMIPAGIPLPTPVPQATVVAEQHLIALVISTFRPIPDTPLKCG
jgi:hypothetical protein